MKATACPFTPSPAQRGRSVTRTSFATYALACGAALLWVCSESYAGQQKDPQVSAFLAPDLKAAQDALTARNFPKALTLLQQAQAAKGDRTAWDNYVIDLLSFKADEGEHNMQEAAAMLLAAAHSQYATAAEQKSWLHATIGTYQSEKQYQKVISTGQDYLARSGFDTDIATMVAVSQQALGRDREAAETVQSIINREAKPEERYLLFQWQLYSKLNDQPDIAHVIDELVRYYPKPDYWLNALQPLLRMQISDAHLQLDVYRLMNDVGALRTPRDYAGMAELAFDAGYPGETVAVLRQAFAQNVFTDQRDILRYQHLLKGTQQKAQTDYASLPAQQVKAAESSSGDPLVAVGAAYLSYGEVGKGVQLIEQGIAKGKLHYPEQASLLLGVAKLRAHQLAEARKTFDRVAKSANEGYAQLGKLWLLHSDAYGAG